MIRPAGAILDFLKRKIMEKELSFEEARELVNSFVELNEAKYSKSYVIGMLQAHLTMCLTGVDKEDIIKQLTKSINGRYRVTP